MYQIQYIYDRNAKCAGLRKWPWSLWSHPLCFHPTLHRGRRQNLFCCIFTIVSFGIFCARVRRSHAWGLGMPHAFHYIWNLNWITLEFGLSFVWSDGTYLYIFYLPNTLNAKHSHVRHMLMKSMEIAWLNRCGFLQHSKLIWDQNDVITSNTYRAHTYETHSEKINYISIWGTLPEYLA